MPASFDCVEKDKSGLYPSTRKRRMTRVEPATVLVFLRRAEDSQAPIY